MRRYLPARWPAWLSAAALSLLLLLAFACSNSSATIQPTSTPLATATSQPIRPAFKNPIIYIALGASDAVGVGSQQPGSQGYVPLLGTKLPPGSHTLNLGVSGIHLHDALVSELPIALTSQPDLVTIWLVANDFIGNVSYDDYMHDLTTLLQKLHSGTHARIVMANLPDLTLLPLLAHQPAAKKAQIHAAIIRWNAEIAVQAQRYHVTVVDLFSHNSQLTAHPEYISGDGFHPSPQGYIQLANYFWQAINTPGLA